MHPDQLAALVAVIDEGSFEAAARQLHITPSAVSQRIKALERHWGRVLVVRTTPCRATGEGSALLRYARQVAELESDVLAELSPDAGAGRHHLPVVVNADSLATWFVPVLAEAATWEDCVLDLLIEVEDHGAGLLRTGQAVGAITSDPTPVPGCALEPLGAMRYVPVCTPALLDRHGAGATDVDWATLPVVRFNDKDDIQHEVLRRHGVDAVEVEHRIPSSQAFVAAVRAGLGWAMVPELQLGESLRDGELVRIGGRGRASDHVDVLLTWQSWRLGSTRSTRLTETIRRAARQALRPVR